MCGRDAHLVGVMRGRGPVMAGARVVDGPNYQTTSEYVLVATSLGKTISKARKRVYGVVDQIKAAEYDLPHRYRGSGGCRPLPAPQKARLRPGHDGLTSVAVALPPLIPV